ncbi:hypothetical protein P8452_08857 [Trifolium repens]|nr:agamous MADS-box protein AGL62 [Trifolium repens]WJX19135.1 hypothetical protein P8452_08857 [Trifolium repens]
MAGNNNAAQSNTRKRKIGEIKKAKNSNKSDMMFSKRKIGLLNKVTELSVLCNAKTALIVTTPDKKLYACGYPNCDAVIQQFLTGKDTMEDGKKKEQEETVETLLNMRQLKINLKKKRRIWKLSLMRKIRAIPFFLFGGVILLMIWI